MEGTKRICVVSMENHTQMLLYRIAHANHAAYCRNNGYEYFEVNDFSKYPPKDKAHWYKYDVIYDAMKSVPADYYLWIDTDAFFTGMGHRLEPFIPDDDAQVMMSKDCDGGRAMYDYGYCNGVMLLKGSPLVLKYMEELCSPWVYRLGRALKTAGIIRFRDQEMMQLLNQIGEYRDIITEIPPKSFQSFPPSRAHRNNAWAKGDCILHMPGMKVADKEAMLSRMGYDLDTGEVGFMGLDDAR